MVGRRSFLLVDVGTVVPVAATPDGSVSGTLAGFRLSALGTVALLRLRRLRFFARSFQFT